MIESSGLRYSTTRRMTGLTFHSASESGVFSGYASIFGEVDLGKDVIEKGAFRKSLARRGAFGVRMLYQHDPAEPIGRWTLLREDDTGLYVEGALTLGVARADEVLSLMRAGALDGLSIGFQTIRARRDEKTGIRRILEADLWEISIVTFPMQPGARVSQIKQRRSQRRPMTSFDDLALAGALRRAGRSFSSRVG